MLTTILSSFKVPEIRKKLLFTAVILALYRLGSFIPVPGVSTAALAADDAALAHARKLLQSVILVDGHNDLPWDRVYEEVLQFFHDYIR